MGRQATRVLYGPTDDLWWVPRGGPVFEKWRQAGVPAVSSKDGRVQVRDPLWILACVPVVADDMEFLERFLSQPDGVLIVDVCYPLMRPDACIPLTGVPGPGLPPWMDPVGRAIGMDAIRRADAVSTPCAAWDGYPEWVEDLADLNPNVFLIPDLCPHREDDLDRFATELLDAWTTTAIMKHGLALG